MTNDPDDSAPRKNPTIVDGEYYEAEADWEAITGTPLDVRNSHWLSYVHPDDRARIERAWLVSRETGWFLEEYRVRTPAGAYRWIRGYGRRRTRPSGQAHWEGYVREISGDHVHCCLGPFCFCHKRRYRG